MNLRSVPSGATASGSPIQAAEKVEFTDRAVETPDETQSLAPQLLVSFRSLEELNDAIVSQVDLIDLKEPQNGPLAPVSVATVVRVHQWLAGRKPLSVALGELVDYQEANFEAHLKCAGFAKLGLAGIRSLANGERIWGAAMDSFPQTVAAVAVAYADFASCDSWEPELVLEIAEKRGWHYFLLDTFDKQRGSVLSHLDVTRLRRLSERARRAGISFALAGSLRHEHLIDFVGWFPEIIAVRGAVTRGDRSSAIDPDKIEDFQRFLADRRCLLPASLTRTLRNGTPLGS